MCAQYTGGRSVRIPNAMEHSLIVSVPEDELGNQDRDHLPPRKMHGASKASSDIMVGFPSRCH